MPRTGGGDTLMTKASWMAANFWFSVAISACALWPFSARSLKRIERREHDGGVGRAGEGGAVEPDDRHGMRDARRVEHDLR